MFGCFHFVKPCGGQIELLDKRHAKLLHVPDEVFRSFKSLEECRLDANQIKELPKNFFKLERIRCLTISDNDLTEIPPGVGRFSQLTDLDVSRNEISVLPNNLRFCSSLSTLDLSNNPLQGLPAGFCELGRLHTLSMNTIGLTNLPDDFGNLQSLEKCELRDNRLTFLPTSFASLTRLEFLDLGSNEFKELPRLLGNLKNLRELWMDDNELRVIPPETGSMQSLQQLDLSENLIESLPEEIGDLISLNDFNLSQNNLNSLPNSFGELKKLTVLKLNQNQLLSLTSSIGNCSNLQELYLTENFLTALPLTLGGLQSMFLLNADHNHISELPPQIGCCTSMNILSLRENYIQRLPVEIGNCSRLRVLDVSGNRLDRLPLSLANCPLTALWLSSNQSQPVVTLQRDCDEVTQEQFLTCYLLPQDQMSAQPDLDPTLSPSDEASLTGPLNLGYGDLEPPLVGRIPTERNLVYEPSQIKPAQSPSRYMPPSSPLPPASMALSSTASTTTGDVFVTSPTKHTMSPHFSPSPRNSIQSGDGDLTLSGTSNSRVHFPSEIRDTSNAKEFPKTRHPRLVRNVPGGYGREHRLSHEFHSPDDLHPSNTTPSSKPDSLHTNHIVNGSPTSHNSPHMMGSGILPNSPYGQEQADWMRKTSGIATPTPSQLLGTTADGGEETPHAKPRRKVLHIQETPTVLDGPSPAGGERSGENELGVSNLSDEEAYSSGGEEICVISRHVGFTEDVEDNEKSSQRLIRRDTPHYTKRARIQSKTADGVDSAEAVLKILQTYNVATSPVDTPATSGVSTTVSDVSNYLPGSSAVSHAAPHSTTYPHAQRTPPASPPTSGATYRRITMNICRQPGCGLGLSIAGGVGSIPYLGSDQGIFVSRLNPNGLAFSSGLRLNDKILEVNGINLVDVEHQVAVSALRSPADQFSITVLRETGGTEPHRVPVNVAPVHFDTVANPTSPIHCTLYREPNGFGFSVAGGRANPSSSLDRENIHISRITEGGAASKCGKLEVGDQVIRINGIDVTDARHDQVISLLTNCGSSVNLSVIRPSCNFPISQANGYLAHQTMTSSASHAYTMPSGRKDLTWPGTNHPSVDQSTTPRPSRTVRLRTEQGYVVDRVTIQLDGGPLGLVIYGGSDINCLPFGNGEPGVFISKISSNGAAQHAGLRIGDRILRVNDMDLRHATHDQAVQALIQSKPTDQLCLEVRRDPSPPGLKRLTINRHNDERFGLRIAVSNEHPFTHPNGNTEGTIFVTWISPDGAAARDGRLKPGDRLLEVNDLWMMGYSLEEALEVFKKAGHTLNLVVSDGSFDHNIPTPFASTFNGRQRSLPQSVVDSAVDHAEERSNTVCSSVPTIDDRNASILSNPVNLHNVR